MLREMAQLVLSFAGYIASFFVSPASPNFNFIQMGAALVMMIVGAVLIWLIPQIFHRDDH